MWNDSTVPYSFFHAFNRTIDLLLGYHTVDREQCYHFTSTTLHRFTFEPIWKHPAGRFQCSSSSH